MILYCFPYAGGSFMSFNNIIRLINLKDFKVQCLELPGRGLRRQEPLHATIEEVLDDFKRQVETQYDLEKEPILLWGHSMGAIIALLLAHQLNELPIKALIVSAMKAPSYKSSFLQSEDYDKIMNISQILPVKHEKTLDTPLFHRFQKRSFEIINHDLALLEKLNTSVVNWTKIKIGQPIYVIRGERDKLFPTPAHYEDWKNNTSETVVHYTIEFGGHFFIMEHPRPTASIIRNVALQFQS